MDSFISTYVHNGVSYTNDSYTGRTMPSDVWNEIQSSRGSAGRIPTREEHKNLYKKKTTPKVEAKKALREALLESASELSKTMNVRSQKEIDDWRIKAGYLWKVTSPSGRVYSEILKKITIEDPKDFITYNAMKKSLYGHFQN